MGSCFRATLYEFGSLFLRILDRGLQVVDFKTERVDGTILRMDNRVHRIPAIVRAETDILNQRISDGEKGDLHPVPLSFNHLGGRQSESLKLFDGTIKVFNDNPQYGASSLTLFPPPFLLLSTQPTIARERIPIGLPKILPIFCQPFQRSIVSRCPHLWKITS